MEHVTSIVLCDCRHLASRVQHTAIQEQRFTVLDQYRGIIGRIPSLHGFGEGSVLQVVVLFSQVVCNTLVGGGEKPLQHFNLRVKALPGTTETEITDRIEVHQKFTEPFQPTEKVVVDTLKVTDTAFQRIGRISLHAVHDIHVWGGGPDCYYLYQTLAVRIGSVINAGKGVPGLYGF